jgi:hypothetical protein
MNWYWVVLIIIVWCIVGFFSCKYCFEYESFNDWVDYILLTLGFIVSPVIVCFILIILPLVFLGWLLKKLICKDYDKRRSDK